MEKNYPEIKLYEINTNVRCVKCGHKGAIQTYGWWSPSGIGNKADEFKFVNMEKYRDNPYMNYVCGFGGTIPWQCTNCDNTGLINFSGLEGYEMAFETIK
jgi:hypothetical protein